MGGENLYTHLSLILSLHIYLCLYLSIHTQKINRTEEEKQRQGRKKTLHQFITLVEEETNSPCCRFTTNRWIFSAEDFCRFASYCTINSSIHLNAYILFALLAQFRSADGSSLAFFLHTHITKNHSKWTNTKRNLANLRIQILCRIYGFFSPSSSSRVFLLALFQLFVGFSICSSFLEDLVCEISAWKGTSEGPIKMWPPPFTICFSL